MNRVCCVPPRFPLHRRGAGSFETHLPGVVVVAPSVVFPKWRRAGFSELPLTPPAELVGSPIAQDYETNHTPPRKILSPLRGHGLVLLGVGLYTWGAVMKGFTYFVLFCLVVSVFGTIFCVVACIVQPSVITGVSLAVCVICVVVNLLHLHTAGR